VRKEPTSQSNRKGAAVVESESAVQRKIRASLHVMGKVSGDWPVAVCSANCFSGRRDAMVASATDHV
jgi:hypothetical protein